MSRPIEVGDVVIDETSGYSHTIERIESGIIHLYEDGRVVLINDLWKLEDSPDHVIKFGQAPGSVSMSVLMKERVPQFLLLVEILYGQDDEDEDVWRIFEDGKITFNSRDEAIEYFLSFGRWALELDPDQFRPLRDINLALYQTWTTQIYERDPPEITELLLYYKRVLQKETPARLDDDTGNMVYRVSVVESTYVQELETMVKGARNK